MGKTFGKGGDIVMGEPARTRIGFLGAGQMASALAHELNQPLTAIANYAHACERLLSRAESDGADLREALRQITVQTCRAADILRRLRTLARSQSAEHTPASLNALVRELYELMQTDALAHGVQLTLDLDPQLPEVWVEPGQIQQAVLNLVRNSLDALAVLSGEHHFFAHSLFFAVGVGEIDPPAWRKIAFYRFLIDDLLESIAVAKGHSQDQRRLAFAFGVKDFDRYCRVDVQEKVKSLARQTPV